MPQKRYNSRKVPALPSNCSLQVSLRVTMENLSDEVLLIIFQHYLDASPRCWPELVHVCRSWRRVIFTSPLGLHLRLYCTYGTPVLKNLDCWPTNLPLVLDYVGYPMHRPPAPEDEDNIMAALEQSDRVCFIGLTVSSSLLKKLSTISEPISELEELVLLSQDNVQFTLRAGALWWGHRLRTLHSTRIAIPSLPQLLLPSQDLVDLQLHEIPGVGYFSPEALANALCGMTRLETLSLHFLSFPRRNYLGSPPSSGDRVVLPALTCFIYRGISKYLDSLVARIDAPRLEDINITFFNQPTLGASQLGLFVDRVEMRSLPLRVDILFSVDAISITITITTQPGALRKWIELQIPCEQLDWQLSSISQICDHFSTLLSRVEYLGIGTTRPSSMPDDMDDEQWLRLIHAFDCVKDFRLAGELATDVWRALCPADEGHKIVLPALQILRVMCLLSMDGPLRDSLESLVTQRQLSGHPVHVVNGRKKAVMVGINYSAHRDSRFRLRWSVKDAHEMARFLHRYLGFERNDIRILTDDQYDQPWNLPTEGNIRAAMSWLVESAQIGDSLFFYFSGHATQVKDTDGDELDGLDECICAMDFVGNERFPISPTTPGIIVDDDMHDIMVRPLPRGCRLTAILDCCHSGTLLDLPFIYDSSGTPKPTDPILVQRKSSKADVISLSACKDSERAFEVREGGALRRAFVEYMTSPGSRRTYCEMIRYCRAYMDSYYLRQRPQLSSCRLIDVNQPFII